MDGVMILLVVFIAFYFIQTSIANRQRAKIIEQQRIIATHLGSLLRSVSTTQSHIAQRKRHQAMPGVEKAKADQHYEGTGVPRVVSNESTPTRVGKIAQHRAGGPERDAPDY